MVDRPAIPHEISDLAARWVADRDTGLLGDRDEADLTRWLAADPLHRRAYNRASGLWAALDAVPETAGMRPGADVRRGVGRRRHARRSHDRVPPRRVATAAAAVAALVVAMLAMDLPMRLRADALTATGERELVHLPDGSTARLNTASAIAVDYTPAGRRIRLLRGEAEFTVAPDAARPFTVEAAGGEARALGTRFIVREDASGATVTVTEHRVAVSYRDRRSEVGESEMVRFGASSGLALPRRIEVADAEAWTRGRLSVVNRPLGEVIAELNRYYPGYIQVRDEIADLPVSGNFRIDDPLAAIEQIRHAVGIGSTRIIGRLIFLHR